MVELNNLMDVNSSLPLSFDARHLYYLIGFVGIVLCLSVYKMARLCPAKTELMGRDILASYLRFFYASFLKPHRVATNADQQSALESFYETQATAYDATRKYLLRGRKEMLELTAAELMHRGPQTHQECDRPAWFDIGGGTGYNIEAMSAYLDVEHFFSHVYLIDLSLSLRGIARKRVERLGWRNVTVLCQNARAFRRPSSGADLVTMSYSLSVIHDYYNVVGSLNCLLAPTGVLSVCDFYVQSVVDISSPNYIGGAFNRHVNWLGRMFWRAWFDADRVNLDRGRRDFLEYRFGTMSSTSQRNYFLGGIPYYILIGCRLEAMKPRGTPQEVVAELDAAYTESPYLSPKDYRCKESVTRKEDGPSRSKHTNPQ